MPEDASKFTANADKMNSPIPPEPTDRTTLPPPSSWLPARHRMPYRSLGNRFINKVRDMWAINDILRDSKTVVVEGMGGIGKTQLAIVQAEKIDTFTQDLGGSGGKKRLETERRKGKAKRQPNIY